MSWLASLVVALLTGALGLFAAGFVMNACVGWYRVSSFEGKSGYAVMAVAILGGIAGIVIGLVASRLVPDGASHAFFRGLGLAWGAVLGIAGASAGVAWALADIPPTIDGRELMLDVEIKLPVDVRESPASGTGESSLELMSLSGHTCRARTSGELRPAEARFEDGRWIVPGSVHVFTTRGRRTLGVQVNGEPVLGFLVPLPGRPGREFLEWSAWGPRPPAPQPPWPDTKPSYRFRVRTIEPPPPGPTAEEMAAAEAAEAQARFEAVPADAPVAAWIPWTRYGVTDAQKAAALAHIAARTTLADELGALMLSEDARAAEEALRLVEHVPQASLLRPVAEAGRDVAARIRRVNDLTVEQDPSFEAAADVSIRFGGWMCAVRTLREKCGGDFTPELGEILPLARVRTDSQVMRSDVLRIASYYMKEWTGLEPLPTDPKPR